MKKNSIVALLTVAAIAVAAAKAPAALVISEVMSSSIGTADWFELTNAGVAAATITGNRMDDGSLAFGSSVALLGVASLAPGESAVFIESSSAVADAEAFRSFWTGSTTGLTGVQIGTYSGSGISLSGTSGDGLIVYDSVGTTLAGPVTYPAAAGGFAGQSFDAFNPAFHRSAVGQGGAFASVGGNPHDIASPGTVVPEPASAVLASMILASLVGCRFRSRS